MTAIRVIDNHSELQGVGNVTHSELDLHVSSSAFLTLSGTTTTPSGRSLEFGNGFSTTDNGPGGSYEVNINNPFPQPTAPGQLIMAVTTASFQVVNPITSQQGWLANRSGELLISSSL